MLLSPLKSDKIKPYTSQIDRNNQVNNNGFCLKLIIFVRIKVSNCHEFVFFLRIFIEKYFKQTIKEYISSKYPN